ncbi:MAG TPA: hypothetical protein VKN36_14920 [Eudoraea sp.]|nr:hypothetical protein [Eudoraea sp.]
MSAMYLLAGVMHFIKPKTYMRIIPGYLPWPRLLVYLSGISEIVLGIGLCFAEIRDLSIYGILLMLTIFLSVHVSMITEVNTRQGIPLWILILRLPLQGVLMYWAWWYLQY